LIYVRQPVISLPHLRAGWNVLKARRDRPYLSNAALAGARKFLEDPVAWSGAHGGVESAEAA
jgi:orotate phosphoribosyltransferase